MKIDKTLESLKLETIEDLMKFLKDFFKDEKVEIYLFGSRARGDNTPFSDIDIGFLAKEDISNKLTVLRYILEEGNFPYKVDLVDLSYDSELLACVLREGKKWL